jgi:hypothetical protein
MYSLATWIPGKMWLLVYIVSCVVPGLQAQTIPPPVLIYPVKADTISELYPAFNWANMYASAVNQSPLYQVRLVEVYAGQTAEAAIQANPDYWTISNVKSNATIYPVSAPLLKKQQCYAWQVTALYPVTQAQHEQVTYGTRTVASEVFSFVVNDPMSDQDCIPLLYRKLDARFYVFEDKLKFQLPTEVATMPDQLHFQIVDLKGNPVVTDVITPVKEVKKDQYSISLARFEVFRKRATRNRFYILEAKTVTGEVYQLKFTVN